MFVYVYVCTFVCVCVRACMHASMCIYECLFLTLGYSLNKFLSCSTLVIMKSHSSLREIKCAILHKDHSSNRPIPLLTNYCVCSIYRYVNKYNLPLTVFLHANCYTPFHGASERVTSGGAVWLVVPSCICSCNKYVQYVTVATGTGYKFMRETNYMLEWHSR